jgi:hypothetical protein
MRDFPTNENPVLWSSLASADLLLSQRFSASFAFVVSTHASTKVHISLDNNDAANQQSSTFQGSIKANHTPTRCSALTHLEESHIACRPAFYFRRCHENLEALMPKRLICLQQEKLDYTQAISYMNSSHLTHPVSCFRCFEAL